MLDETPSISEWTLCIDTQTMNTQEDLDNYWDLPEYIWGLLLQWVVTWALPEIYEELIRKRKEKSLSTFVISSWYHDRWEINFWNYESIQRNQDAWAIYLNAVNLKDMELVWGTLSELVSNWIAWKALEDTMREKFCKTISRDEDVRDETLVVLDNKK